MMPDIQTEMQKILQSWEEPETTETESITMFTPTTNTSRATFEEVRDMPGLPPKEYVRRLTAKGHKSSSVSSLLGQMVRQGVVWRDSGGTLRPNGTEYTPLKTAKKFTKQTKKPKTLKVKTSNTEAKGLAALVNEPMARAFEHQPDIRTSLDVLMDALTLNDAHELYRRLHLYFGGLGK
jgi:hypothetical protein